VTVAPFDPDRLRAVLPPLGEPVPAAVADFHAHYSVPAARAIDVDAGTVEAPAGRVVVHVLRPAAPRGSVIFVHGLFDHAVLWRHQMRWALDRGLAVCAFDLPGHGLSDGAVAHVDDFGHYVDALEAVFAAARDALPGPLVGVGQSTGCSVLMESVRHPQRGAVPFDDLVLLAPLVRLAGDRLGRPLLPMIAPFVQRLPRALYGNTNDPEFNRFQREDDLLQPRSLPVTWVRAMTRWSTAFDRLPPSSHSPCVVQGDRDATVAWKRNLPKLRAAFAEPEVVMLEGAKHNLMNETAAHRARIETALDARLAQLFGEMSGKED
jgi:alpha-beta hydrolase superfamily lysophospholipase